jgi:hypothetical protein
VDAGQLVAGIDAELLGEQPPAVGEHPQRLGLPPAAVQRDHQQSPHPLPQRVVGHHGREVRDNLLVTAQRQQDVRPLLRGRGAQLAQACPLGLGERAWHPRERHAPPQRERRVERAHRARQVAALAQLAGPGEALLERDGVGLARHQVQHVPGTG